MRLASPQRGDHLESDLDGRSRDGRRQAVLSSVNVVVSTRAVDDRDAVQRDRDGLGRIVADGNTQALGPSIRSPAAGLRMSQPA